MRTRTKAKIKKIICIALAALLILGAVGGAIAIFGNDKRDISVTEFHLGGLDEQGEYLKQENTVYTREFIECQGLTVEPKSECTVSYRIFFYDQYKTFLKATELDDGMYTDVESAAKYCKIVVYPDGYDDKDFKIGFFDVWGYADDIKISVDKKQNFNPVDWFETCLNDEKGHGSGVIVDSKSATESAEVSYVGGISCAGYQSFVFIYGDQDSTYSGSVVFFNADEEYVSTVNYTVTDNGRTVINVPDEATEMYVNYNNGVEFVINSYEIR